MGICMYVYCYCFLLLLLLLLSGASEPTPLQQTHLPPHSEAPSSPHGKTTYFNRKTTYSNRNFDIIDFIFAPVYDSAGIYPSPQSTLLVS